MNFHVDIIAVGKMKPSSPFHTPFENYVRRLSGKLNVIELEGKNQADELQKIKSKLNPDIPLIILDERGKSMPSPQFAKKLEQIQRDAGGKFQCVIGGADGLDDELRQKASSVISFGAQTWPHMMVRMMLVEQIYRAQQIIAGHPYHRA